MLTYVSTKGKSDGADKAAKFYHRNLFMFSNSNQIQVTTDDRIIILMAGTNTAFFNDLLNRSLEYKAKMVLNI